MIFANKSQMFVYFLLNCLFTFFPGAVAFEPSLIVKATDLDGPTQGNGQVFYSIKSVNTDSTIFDIDGIGGEITLIRPARYFNLVLFVYFFLKCKQKSQQFVYFF